MITTALDAIASARHADPFSVLGPHVEHGLLTIRTCLPAAEAVSVLVDGEAPLAMTRTHPVGIYEATLPEPASHGGSFDYRLRVTYPGGYHADVDDPYRFGRVITDYDLYLFGEGNHTRIHDKLGAHPMTIGSTEGVHFAVWAPNATRVSVVGDFNGWDGRVHPMRRLGVSGVWEIFVPTAAIGNRYKFELRTAEGHDCRQGRPVRIRVRGAAAVGVDRFSPRLRLGRRGVDGPPRGCRIVVRAADGRVRSAPRFLGADAERRK